MFIRLPLIARGVAKSRAVFGLAGIVAVIAAASIAPATAGAAIVADGAIQFPANTTVGDLDVPGKLIVTNANTGADDTATNTICNPSAPTIPPDCTDDDGILFTPACTTVSGNACTAPDPSVFNIGVDPGGDLFVTPFERLTRRADEPGPDECDVSFGVPRETEPNSGTYVMKPQPNQTLTLGPDESCYIPLYVSVLNAPVDAIPGTPGLQTRQLLTQTQHSGGVASATDVTTSVSTVNLNSAATITGKASLGVPVGGVIYDQATVDHLVGANSKGTVTFRLYPPSDGACTGTPVFTDTQDALLSGKSGSAVSNVYAPKAPGIYRWTATYNGDSRNLPTSPTPCASLSQDVEITPSSAVDEPPINPVPTPPTKQATGKRAAAMKKCRKAKKKKKKKKCLRRARKLPV